MRGQAEKIRILLVFGTRPEAIKMAPVVKVFQSDNRFTQHICVSGQHRDLLDSAMAEYGIRPDFDFNLMGRCESLGQFTSMLAIELEKVIRSIKPDRILVHGDTCTAFGAAMAAYFQKIPVGHVEAGLRSHNMDSPWPEEANRRLVGALADLHFAPTEAARLNLIAEGVTADSIIVTGNTIADVVSLVRRQDNLAGQTGGIMQSILDRAGAKPFILVTAHRRENQGPALEELCKALRELAGRGDACYVCLVHPNPYVAAAFSPLNGTGNILLLPPQSHRTCLTLLQNCRFLITDSGGLLEEAALLGKQSLIFRKATERPETLNTGLAELVGICADALVIGAVKLLGNKGFSDTGAAAGGLLYGDGTAARKIVAHIAKIHSAPLEI